MELGQNQNIKMELHDENLSDDRIFFEVQMRANNSQN